MKKAKDIMAKKLSEIILEMIEPYKDDDLESMEKLIITAICAWNMTLVSEQESEETFELLLQNLKNDKKSKKAYKSLIEYFVRFKLDNYAHDMRHIINYTIDTSCDSPELLISSIEPKSTITVPEMVDNNIGRNDPCPCGSAKKYKKCCGKNI